MPTFTLTDVFPTVELTTPSNLTRAQLLEFRPFREWLATLRKSLALQSETTHPFHESSERYSLRTVNIHSVEYFGTRIGFLTLEAVVQNSNDPKPLPGIVFLRGSSIAILMILRSEEDIDKRWVVMTSQPRIPAGSLTFFEIPAGMIDDSGTFVGAAATEIREETGLTVPRHELVDMTKKALQKSQNLEAHMQNAMYPSPGGCDEFIVLFLWERTMSTREVNELRGKIARKDREKITIKLVEYEHLWREGARDAKSLAAWALYENLSREGSLN